MKKLVLFAAVVLGMSVMSCGKGEKAEAADSAAVDSTAAVEEVAPVADSVAADTVAPADSAVKA